MSLAFSAPLLVLDAPSNLGLMPPAPGREPGVRFAPDALRARGLLPRLRAGDAGRIPAPAYGFDVSPEVQVRNAPGLALYTRQLAGALTPLLDGGAFPLVLGGDCSILPGSMLALAPRGRHGLVFIDGHQDLLTPETSRSKGAAGMDLALTCGLGPPSLTVLDGRSPLVDAADVVMLGDRSGDGQYPGAEVASLRDRMWRADVDAWRRGGIAAVVAEGLTWLRHRGIDGLWIHFDVDVLENGIMPAVDSPQPGGLSWDELDETLVTLLRSGRAVGLQLTIFDPILDPEGAYAERIVAALERAFLRARGDDVASPAT